AALFLRESGDLRDLSVVAEAVRLIARGSRPHDLCHFPAHSGGGVGDHGC
ncbi:MAG: hypothetical protein JWM68_5400, partial [Verrucomicrobiales bacterium]|nr:hypothetical protein [Verrucomicrobiales bacterium]